MWNAKLGWNRLTYCVRIERLPVSTPPGACWNIVTQTPNVALGDFWVEINHNMQLDERFCVSFFLGKKIPAPLLTKNFKAFN